MIEIIIIALIFIVVSFLLLSLFCSLVVSKLSDEESEKYLEKARENTDNDI